MQSAMPLIWLILSLLVGGKLSKGGPGNMPMNVAQLNDDIRNAGLHRMRGQSGIAV